MSTPIPVALIGLGGVGRSILSQLLSPILSEKFTLVLIANSRLSLSLPLAAPLTLTNHLPILEQHGTPLDLPSIISILSTHPSSRSKGSILIDSTGSDSLPGMYSQILSMGINIVTPNKKAASGSLSSWENIQKVCWPIGKAIYYGESTVGAGLPILSTLKDLVETGDEIQKIEGVFSGTLSYIFNQFSTVEISNVKFSEVVKIAKEKGYTEPDPRDDLSGTDVARKLTILSRLVPTSPILIEGYASVPTQSLVPSVLQDANTKEDYLQRLEEGDEYFDKIRKEAENEGMVIRYVGVVDIVEGKVEAKLAKYPKDHAFATSLKGSDNIISFHTKRYSPRPLIIQGAGAGADVTAMGVTSDMLKIYERLCTVRI
ncbi:hypothetical protein TREMEDRAFT_37511 [Tremella mesenterica DSM 1558]|uniref:uncharacterized protein n=1 Tax=Tremella mesenterica (strain ATCC 24925 / CBS 8224 / DSM 1558 / NBRC 9311 / NRRL Y-6157 / RJB 2259-6 / UBC 559-6) TaxID=578456 RepID=UPI0003F4A161|nr:uncharacterized protein TREMEDRAFT_37511 [Tremella mesenterica DSM 1558]EIW71019.1 hypothetical protein TREMEDRAFT_37511 [Tremella mesenterica DSM 1558]